MEFLEVFSSVISSLNGLLANETLFVFVCSMFVVSLALLVALVPVKGSGGK